MSQDLRPEIYESWRDYYWATNGHEEPSRLDYSPMTLCIGLIASDGWIIASDKRLYEQTPTNLPDGRIITTSFFSNTSKIHWVPDVNVVYTFSGDHISALAGEGLISELRHNPPPPDSRATLLNALSYNFWTTHARFSSNVHLKRDLLVVFTTPPVELWTVSLGLPPAVGQHDDKALIGDIGSGPSLFPSLYYKPAKCEKLVVLAAHTILMGHRCNPSLIEGLEMYVGKTKDGTVRCLVEKELSDLRDQSSALSQQIGSLFD